MKHVRQKWTRISKRKMDAICNSPPKPINKVSKNAAGVPGLNMNQDLYLLFLYLFYFYLQRKQLKRYNEHNNYPTKYLPIFFYECISTYQMKSYTKSSGS